MAKVTTKYGEMDEKALEKFEYPDTHGAHIVEYYLNKELVHRSAVTRLTGVQATGEAQKFGT